MNIALIADTYAPLRTSGAIQLRDLSREFVTQGHSVTVIIPSAELRQSWCLEEMDGVRILRLRAPRTKDIGYLKRTIGELLMPFLMLHHFRRSPLASLRWDGVVWYSPSIFLGPIASSLKKSSTCRGYLVVRDIFPEWAVDMGLMSRGLPYLFFKAIERYQYSVADVIGVQTPANLPYFDASAKVPSRRVEVLQNWLAEAADVGCSISVASSPLAGRTIFLYAGNMGIAQGISIILELAESLRDRPDIGFLFVGRGTELPRLRQDANSLRLENVLFYDEVDPSEIPGLYAQCHVGVVTLDPRHKTHNIPGKFLSYMQSGLPVLASINPGTDLLRLIENERVGRVITNASAKSFSRQALALLDDIYQDVDIKIRCRNLASKLFSPKVAVQQIVKALNA